MENDYQDAPVSLGSGDSVVSLGPGGWVAVLLSVLLIVLGSYAKGQDQKLENLQNQTVSQVQQINSLRKQLALQQQEIKDLRYARDKRFEWASQVRQMCRALRQHENLPGGQWDLYVPANLQEGQEDFALCVQGNVPLQSIPMVKPIN